MTARTATTATTATTGIEREVRALLEAPAETVTASAGDGYGWAVHRHRYPPALPGLESVPAELRAGQLEIFLPDGRCWAPAELHDVLGRPARSGRRFAGTAVVDGEPRCWIADVRTRRVQLLDADVGLTAGDGNPVAWSGGSLVLPAPAPARLRDPQYVFEAEPGERIRMALPEATAGHLRLRYLYVDPAGEATRAAPLAPRGYRDIRAGGQGAVAAYAPGLVAVSRPDSGDEQVIELGSAPLLDFQWLPGLVLVLVLGHADGFDVVSHSGGARHILHRHRGRFLHSDHEGGLLLLFEEEHGGHTVLIVDDGTARAVRLGREGREEGVGAAPRRIVAAGPGSGSGGGRRFATLDARGDVAVWTTIPGAATAVRLSGHRLPAGRRPVTVRRWDDVALTGTATPAPRTRSSSPPSPPPLAPVSGRSAARAALHLPRGPVSGTLVWLSQAGPGAALAPDPAWLTLDGHAVLDLRVDLSWWPGTPDEQIRPRLAGQIRDAVLECDPVRHTGSPFLAVGGASFGATLALVALADCELFATGIAQSGAYSRHLTALGFQDERRTLWQAPELYRDFDALAGAPGIRHPVLVVHGEADRNPATPVTQAFLLFQALTANGTRTRLVVLPGEGHTVRSRHGLAAALAAKSDWLTTTGKEARTTGSEGRGTERGISGTERVPRNSAKERSLDHAEP